MMIPISGITYLKNIQKKEGIKMNKIIMLIVAIAMVAVFLPKAYAADTGQLGLTVTFKVDAPLTITTTPAGPFKIAEAANLGFIVTAQDANASNVTLSCGDLPKGATFASSKNAKYSGIFSWTPAVGQAQDAAYQIVFSAKAEVTNADGTVTVKTATLTALITITPATIATIPAGSALSAVSAATGTITIEDRIISVPADVKINWYDNYKSVTSAITLSYLMQELSAASNVGATIEVYSADILAIQTSAGYSIISGSTINFHIKVVTATIPIGSILTVVDVNNMTLTMGGRTALFMKSVTISWWDGVGVSMSLSDLAAKLQANLAAGTTVETCEADIPIEITDKGWFIIPGSTINFQTKAAPVISIELGDTSLNLDNVKLGEQRYVASSVKNTGNVPVVVAIGYATATPAYVGAVHPGTAQGTDTFVTMIGGVVIPPSDTVKACSIKPNTIAPLNMTYGAPTALSLKPTGMSTGYQLKAYPDTVSTAALTPASK